MKCVLCNRPMLAAAVSIPTRGGPINYGPVCARKAGLVQKVGHVSPTTRKARHGPEKRLRVLLLCAKNKHKTCFRRK